MKNTVRIAAALFFALTSAACQNASSLVAPTLTPSESSSNSAATATSLVGASWRLVGINGQQALTSVSVTAVFGAANSLSGSGGCNRYVGAAIAKDGKLTVGPLASTRMYCPETGVADQEDAYFSALAKATDYTVVGTELRLTGGATLVFVRD